MAAEANESHESMIANLLQSYNCSPESAFYKVLEDLVNENHRLATAADVAQKLNYRTQDEYWRLQERYDERLSHFNQLYNYHCTYKEALETTRNRLYDAEAQLALRCGDRRPHQDSTLS